MKTILLTLSISALLLASHPAAAQSEQDQQTILNNFFEDHFISHNVPINNHAAYARTRLTPLNLDFSQCSPPPGSRCSPANNWQRDGVGVFGINWSAYGFRTPGAAVISAPNYQGPYQTFGAFGQCFSAADARGQTLTLAGAVAASSVYYGYAGLWVRIDDSQGNTLALDNMYGRGLQGQTGYVQLAAGAYVPANAAQICIGGLLSGTGAAYFDDFTIYYN